MDITRNVCVREVLSEAASSVIAAVVSTAPLTAFSGNIAVKKACATNNENTKSKQRFTELTSHRNSLPNLSYSDFIDQYWIDSAFVSKKNDKENCEIKLVPWKVETTTLQRITPDLDGELKKRQKQYGEQSFPATINLPENEETNEVCAVSGRLEIRVLPEENINREESVYYDALAGVDTAETHQQQKNILKNNSSGSDCKSKKPPQKEQDARHSPTGTANSLYETTIKYNHDVCNERDVPFSSEELFNNQIQKVKHNSKSVEGNSLNSTVAAVNKSAKDKIHKTCNTNRDAISAVTSTATLATGRISSSVVGVTLGSTAASLTSNTFVSSKIPIFNPNLRLSKCASWAGCDIVATNSAPPEQELAPDSNNSRHDIKSQPVGNDGTSGSTLENSSYIMEQNSALWRRRESAERYVADPVQLNLRHSRGTRGSTTGMGFRQHIIGQFDDHVSEDTQEKYIQNRNSAVPFYAPHNISKGSFNNLHTAKKSLNDNQIHCNSMQERNPIVEIAVRNNITPPPGAPKLENSARLRRYRHNID